MRLKMLLLIFGLLVVGFVALTSIRMGAFTARADEPFTANVVDTIAVSHAQQDFKTNATNLTQNANVGNLPSQYQPPQSKGNFSISANSANFMNSTTTPIITAPRRQAGGQFNASIIRSEVSPRPQRVSMRNHSSGTFTNQAGVTSFSSGFGQDATQQRFAPNVPANPGAFQSPIQRADNREVPIASARNFSSVKPNNSSNAFGSNSNRPFKSKINMANSFSDNAEEIKYLVRAQYKLPAEAAKTLEQFFAFDETKKVETKILTTGSKKLIKFQVTTDAATQKAISQFLGATYSAERIKAIEVGTIAVPSGVRTVSLKLPGMT